MSEQVMTKKKLNVDIKTIIPFLGLVVVLVLFEVLTQGKLFSGRNLKAILNDGIYILLGAIGYSFLFAQGMIDFSIGANVAVSCAVACIAANINPVLAFPAALFTGVIIGSCNGFIHAKIGIDSFITTLAMQFLLNGLVLVILDGSTLAAPLSMLKWFTTPLKLGTLALFVVVGYFMFEHSSYGKKCRAVGSCAEAVRQSGINVQSLKFISFAVMGCIAGLIAFFSLIRTGSATSNTGSPLLMNVLNAALLGGLPMSGGATAKFRGVIIGSLTIAFMTSGMTILGLSVVNQQLVKGAVFLIAIAVSFDRKNMKVIK